MPRGIVRCETPCDTCLFCIFRRTNFLDRFKTRCTYMYHALHSFSVFCFKSFFFVCYVRLNATVPLPGFFVVFLSLLCLCCERVIAFSSLFSLMFLFGFGKTRRKSLRLANWTACLSVTEPSAARQRTEGGRTAHVYGAVFAWNVVSCLSYFCADGAPF